MSMPPLRPLALALVLATMCSACGFQLRGQATQLVNLGGPLQLAGLAIQDPLYTELRQALRVAGAEAGSEPGGAAVLRISGRQSTRRVLSVDTRNKALEYELEESFLFSVHGADGSERVPEQRLRALRVIFNPEDEVLGRNREEDLLRGDMRRDLANRLVERLAAQL